MWIRNQTKDSLIDTRSIIIRNPNSLEKEIYNYYFENQYFKHDSFIITPEDSITVLGTYSTEERAIKSLDMIQ